MQTFRLATLLKMRERERDQAAMELQAAQQALAKLQDSKHSLQNELRSMNEQRKAASSGAVDLQFILDIQRFQMVLNAQVQQIDEHIGQVQQELERREQTLLRCQQAVKSLEKLREQRNAQAMELENLRQQERTDEWASVRFASDIQQRQS